MAKQLLKTTGIVLLLSLYVTCCTSRSYAQDISLKSQFNGRYDYTAIGNTLNLEENESATDCQILTESSASLNLNSNQTITAAYLYWSGSGPGDFEVELNGQSVSAEETFSYSLDIYREFFAAFADVSDLVIEEGSTNYTLSNLDLTENIGQYYCSTGTNFGGWSIIVIYEDPALPLNQVGVYDGLQAVSINNTSITINLDNLNVIDNEGAKIGFLAWEGDQQLAVEESLIINGDVISNPPLNPSDNAFNGTNSFTGADDLFNMDLDVYNIENNIQPGDESATIVLNSGNGTDASDFVMVNNIVTVLNSQLPEPEPEITALSNTCAGDSLTINYTVNNFNSTAPLPAGNPIDFFIDNTLLGTITTQNPIPIDGVETGEVTFALPGNSTDNFMVQMRVNTDDNGDLFINEINPQNNVTSQNYTLEEFGLAQNLLDLSTCDDLTNDGTAIFDLSINAQRAIGGQTNAEVEFYRNQSDAQNQNSIIQTPENFENEETPQVIFLRLSSADDENCVVIDSFVIDVFYQPQEVELSDLTQCIPEGYQGSVHFNLEQKNEQILNAQPGVAITYFQTENAAEEGENPINNPENFEPGQNPSTIWVRITNPENECYSLSSFQTQTSTNTVERLGSIQNCDEGFDQAIFDLTQVENQLTLEENSQIEGYYTSLNNAYNAIEPIIAPENYRNVETGQLIFIRISNPENCDRYKSFLINVRNCPPFIPDGFSPNADGLNDRFSITGLYDIFPDFSIKIYSRYGNLIYEGNNSIEAWDGTANHGIFGKGSQMPSGTYYYVLNLNDPDYSIFKGWVYINR